MIKLYGVHGRGAFKYQTNTKQVAFLLEATGIHNDCDKVHLTAKPAETADLMP